uniref:Uncharacterized protein n=1 Tax=Oryza meridionalis TaxID=40149 RepID=A0A0E0EZ04_9ORYZ
MLPVPVKSSGDSPVVVRIRLSQRRRRAPVRGSVADQSSAAAARPAFGGGGATAAMDVIRLPS